MTTDIAHTLATTHPYDVLPEDVRAALARDIAIVEIATGQRVYAKGDVLTVENERRPASRFFFTISSRPGS